MGNNITNEEFRLFLKEIILILEESETKEEAVEKIKKLGNNKLNK